ncbi:hypothetical protein R3P38DRAFT_2788397 [Favolaschia claudopus]|uniref:Uncharacterized protein n=1 Tax=Favolaschia claudopus TaxID=2862362 RepID=A0AAW0ALR9_9AGAR
MVSILLSSLLHFHPLTTLSGDVFLVVPPSGKPSRPVYGSAVRGRNRRVLQNATVPRLASCGEGDGEEIEDDEERDRDNVGGARRRRELRSRVKVGGGGGDGDGS